MKCPYCYQEIPEFLVSRFKNRDKMCPWCMRYYHKSVKRIKATITRISERIDATMRKENEQ